MFDADENPGAHEAPSGAAAPTTTCQASGCSEPTTHGKPYCADHVTLLPSVQALMARWEKVALYSEDGRCVIGESDLGIPAPGERQDLERSRSAVTQARVDRESLAAERRASILEALGQLGEGRHTVTAIAERAGYALSVVGQELRGLARNGHVTSYAGAFRLAHVPA